MTLDALRALLVEAETLRDGVRRVFEGPASGETGDPSLRPFFAHVHPRGDRWCRFCDAGDDDFAEWDLVSFLRRRLAAMEDKAARAVGTALPPSTTEAPR